MKTVLVQSHNHKASRITLHVDQENSTKIFPSNLSILPYLDAVMTCRCMWSPMDMTYVRLEVYLHPVVEECVGSQRSSARKNNN